MNQAVRRIRTHLISVCIALVAGFSASGALAAQSTAEDTTPLAQRGFTLRVDP